MVRKVKEVIVDVGRLPVPALIALHGRAQLRARGIYKDFHVLRQIGGRRKVIRGKRYRLKLQGVIGR